MVSLTPVWLTPVPPFKHVHASHNTIAALSLQSHYENYLRPYTAPITEEDQIATNAGRKRKLEGRKFDKGYSGLLDDCIGACRRRIACGRSYSRPDAHSLVQQPRRQPAKPSLISDVQGPADPLGRVAPDVWEGPIEMLGPDAFAVATLEAGQTQSGVGPSSGLLQEN